MLDAKQEQMQRLKVERKLKLADALFQLAYETKCFQLKKKYPLLSQREINHKAYALIEKGCS